MSNKKIVRAPEMLDLTRRGGCYATAKEALVAFAPNYCLENFGFCPVEDCGLPQSFKLAVKVRFTRTDGKVVTRKVLKTVKSWGFGWTEQIPWGSGSFQYDEVYYPAHFEFSTPD